MARRWFVLTVVLLGGCFAHSHDSYRPTYEGSEACDYYGPHGSRASYFYAPGSDIGQPRGAPPNDHYYYGGGPTIAYGPPYGPRPPGYCPKDK